MNITRNNYEEFFMLYADNELSAADRKEVEAFIAANPGMQAELDLFQQFKCSPDDSVTYSDKEALMKTMHEAGAVISLTNYESFFILYADDELTAHEKSAVEEFVYQHPQLQPSFELLQEVKLRADNNVVFKNKESLYRKEKDDRVVPFRWWRIAAAAMVLLTAGVFWLTRSTNTNSPGTKFVKTTPAVTNPQPPSFNNKETKTSSDTNSNEQPEKEMMATKNDNNTIPKIKDNRAVHTNTAAFQTKVEKDARNIAELAVVAPKKQEVTAEGNDNRIAPARVSSFKNENRKQAVINTDIAAAASKSVTDHQLTYTDTDDNEKAIATQAVANNNNELEVLNTSVNTKNSLRGFFRKASRLIAKKTTNSEDDSKNKSILIGGFEIAVR